MNTRTRTNKLFAMAVAMVMVASIWASWGARPAKAIIIIGGKTGLFSIAQGQTVRISTLNAAQTRGVIGPCVRVHDMAGNVIAEYEGGALLSPGQGTFFDFDASLLGLRAGQRAQIRVEVEFEQPPDPQRTQPPDPVRPGDAIVTVEVFDNDTGKTTFTMPMVFDRTKS